MTPMHTHNETVVHAPLEPTFRTAADVERWPEILPHYRWVTFHREDGFGRGRVEMAAHRHFGPLPYPTWWVSEMEADPDEGVIRYRHVDGITEGMDVEWRLTPADGDGPDDGGGGVARTRVVIVHDWEGPGWPLIGRFAAERVIGPHFVHVVADRTLAGIRARAEREARRAGASDSGGAGGEAVR
mgnify:CR=1 FL=1